MYGQCGQYNHCKYKASKFVCQAPITWVGLHPQDRRSYSYERVVCGRDWRCMNYLMIALSGSVREEYYRENATSLQVGLMGRRSQQFRSPDIGVRLLHTHQQAPTQAPFEHLHCCKLSISITALKQAWILIFNHKERKH